ncbi:MAG: PSD1 and planctomycete cytochrome C domain-containing protein [Planctomycetaceae bacterium]
MHPASSNFLKCFAIAVVVSSVSLLSGEERISYNRDVRSILSDRCFFCHGPDSSHREADLRLDVRAAAVASVIQPGNADESELLKRLLSTDPDVQMPPPKSGKSVSADEIEVLRRWINEGAEYQGHWAFEPVVRPLIPQPDAATVKSFPGWTTNPVDRFLLKRMQAAGLRPNPDAERETLIRRASLDLTGLPPTPAEVAEFVNDASPDAWERVIDRLQASPHYGERMALNWLDYARYADSNGFQSDGSRDIWAWRDWVINAYNRNLPFDRFTIEQIAGDMLPDATREQIIATGFNRNHRLNGEGGRIVDEWFVETVIDRVETTGLTWLGLTLNCCRCHDHKYDPVSQKEFYQLFAFYNSVEESGVLSPQGKNGENTPPLLTISTPEEDAKLAELQQTVSELESQLRELNQQLPAMLTAWEATIQKTLKNQPEVWNALTNETVTSRGGATFTEQPDGSWLAGGKNPSGDTYEVTAHLKPGILTAVLLDVYPDDSLPNQSLGRAFNGNFVLTSVTATLAAPTLETPLPIEFSKAEADYSQPNWPGESVITGKGPGWAVDGNSTDKRLHRRLMMVTASPIQIPDNAVLTVTLNHRSQYRDHNVGRFAISTSSVPGEVISLNGDGLPSNIAAILKIDANDRKPKQVQALRKFFQESVPNPIRDAMAARDAAKKAVTDFQDNLTTTMVMKEGAVRDAFVLQRGEYDRAGEKVGRALPAFLPPLPEGAPLNRLGLAEWIVSETNPLTARVWVNREWERFFGTGIVKTTENFGSQAEFPSHPELLDWLASEFMRPTVLPAAGGVAAQPWDMKAFQKLILLSSAYRQSSQLPQDAEVRERLAAEDPTNRLLSHGPRVRLPGEIIRDQALAISGLLVSEIGGPSVRPYMPAGVWDETSKYGNLRNYKADDGPGLYRRSMYTIWKRTAAPPSMLLFDAPNREVCTIKRSRTNTPLQALSLLNEVTFVEAARMLAMRILAEGGDTDTNRLTFGFQLATARRPTSDELQVLQSGLEDDRRRLNEQPEAVAELLAVGRAERPTGLEYSSAELAAWTLTANILLNLDEVVTRE